MRKRVDRVPSWPMYTETFAQFKKRLGQLDEWLGAAADYAKSKNFDPDVFRTLRDREDFEGTAIRIVSQPRWKANG